jgi:phenylpropionate dioxygenase-like ring-hydroxylating dioxygenase large terminal subunit
MFVHQQQLRHLLRPDQYYSEQQYRLEMERVLLPAWHVVGTTADLPRSGDYITFELFGRPLLVRNIDGQIHTFLNVCAHRHCLLTSQPKGHDPHFRCQYHGWEYQADGRTGHIPEARHFRPWDRENSRLHKFRTERCGQLIFVSLAADGPGLREQIGPFWETAVSSYDGDAYRLVWKYDASYRTNWKVPLENSLESYHVPCLHSATFGQLPPEDQCEHDLDPSFTTFRVPEPTTWFTTHFTNWAVRRLGLTPTGIYTNHHVHPTITFTSLDVFRFCQLFLPTSPTTCRHLGWLYTIRGTRRGPFNWLLARLLSPIITSVTYKVVREDLHIFAEVQRGMHASPHRGAIGIREERLYVFQEYLARRCGDPILEERDEAPAAEPSVLPENSRAER